MPTYQEWLKNPQAYNTFKVREDNGEGGTSRTNVPDIDRFMQEWDAGKAMYADRNNPGIAARDVYNPTMSLEQWLATNPNISTNPENDYMRSQYLIPTQGNDFMTNYGHLIAMGGMGALAAGVGAVGGSYALGAEGAGAAAAGSGGAGLGAGVSSGLTAGAEAVMGDLAGSGLTAWEAASAPSLASQGAYGAVTGNAGLGGLEALGATGGAGTLSAAQGLGGAPVADLTALPSGGLPASTVGTTGAATGGLGSLVPSGGSTFGIPNNLLLGGLQAGLGYLGSSQQADAYKDVAAQQGAYGAPYRALLEQSYQPGFDLWSQPGYADAANRAADIATRQLAARAGNPAGNPTAQAGIYRDVLNETFLPTMANYRGQLGQFSGLGLNQSGNASMASAQQTGNMWNGIGYGLNTILNPQSSDEDILKKYGLLIGGVKA